MEVGGTSHEMQLLYTDLFCFENVLHADHENLTLDYIHVATAVVRVYCFVSSRIVTALLKLQSYNLETECIKRRFGFSGCCKSEIFKCQKMFTPNVDFPAVFVMVLVSWCGILEGLFNIFISF